MADAPRVAEMILPWRAVQIGFGRSFPFGPAIRTSLTPRETDTLRELARGRVVLEVGAAYGYSAIVMGQVASHVFSIDPHCGYGSLPGSLTEMRENVHAYDLAAKVTIMVGRSGPALAALSAGGATFDLVFIDGDHRAQAVTADIDHAFRLAPNRAHAVAVHDYGEESCGDVRPAVDGTPGRLGVRPHHRVVDTLAVWDAR